MGLGLNVSRTPPREEGRVHLTLMTSLVNSRERESPVLADLAILLAIDHEGLVAGGAELLGFRVVDLKADLLTAEPIACINLCQNVR